MAVSELKRPLCNRFSEAKRLQIFNGYMQRPFPNGHKLLISIPVLRVNTGTMYVHICVYSYSIVDVTKQRNMVNSGVRGTKDKNLRSRCIGKLL